MGNVIIKEVKTKKEQKEFLEFPLKLYKNNPYFVPPLYGDEKKIFRPDYLYLEQAKAVYFNAYKDGKMVGRISGILQYVSNEKWNQKRVRWTRFDSINDPEVSNALFKAVEDFAKDNEMDELVGPLGFSDLEREGLLIEGFDELATFEEQYNYDYYPKLVEDFGFEKEVDWEERQLRLPKEFDERLYSLADKILRKYKLHIPKIKSTKEFLKRYADQFFELLDQTYDGLYQTVPFTENTKKLLLENFNLVINTNYVAVIVDENDKVVCFGLTIPSLAKALQKSKGHLTIPALLRCLKSIKNPEIIDLALIGVAPEYQMKGVVTSLILEIINMLKKGSVKYVETNLNLETNKAIINQWKIFDARLHKKRRSYVKKIQ